MIMENRVIKFRAWCPNEKEWISSTDGEARFSFYEGNVTVQSMHEYWTVQGGEPTESETWTYHEDAIVMQYTGLKDKNGVEIYEGDVVDCDMIYNGGTLPHRGAIEYNSHFGSFCTRNQGGQTLLHNHYLSSLKVIGNIYENPDLLK